MARRKKRLLRRLVDRVLPRPGPSRVVLVAASLAVASVVTVNLAVAFFGETLLNPLSPFCLPAKVHALDLYFQHRARCLWRGGDDPTLPIVRKAARRERLDPFLLQALIEVESEGRCHRISPTGAMGPAQLVGSTARLLRVTDPFDPHQGIAGGARYLKEQLGRFHGNVALAVAAYNAGPGAIHGRVPHNGETEFYVRRVLARWRELEPRRPAPARPRAPARAVSVPRAGRER